MIPNHQRQLALLRKAAESMLKQIVSLERVLSAPAAAPIPTASRQELSARRTAAAQEWAGRMHEAGVSNVYSDSECGGLNVSLIGRCIGAANVDVRRWFHGDIGEGREVDGRMQKLLAGTSAVEVHQSSRVSTSSTARQSAIG